MIPRRKVGERDLRAVGRPTRKDRQDRRLAQLNATFSIAIYLPKNAFRKGNIRDALTVFRERHELSRYAAEEGLELMDLRFKTGKLSPMDGAFREDSRTVLAGHWPIPGNWPIGQLNWLGGRSSKEPPPFINGPKLSY
jgi:hypothetical protein